MVSRTIALFGHSNSGKSPLGDAIEKRASTRDRRFHHFDFGHHLRLAAAGGHPAGLDPEETRHVSSVLNGQLLGNESFGIALKILAWFVGERFSDPDSGVLVLNGLARHVGQAKGLEDAGIRLSLIVEIQCSAEVARRRKGLADQGIGHEDRSGRDDGALDVFRRKVASFENDTRPVLDYYARQGTGHVLVPLGVETTPSDMYDTIQPALVSL